MASAPPTGVRLTVFGPPTAFTTYQTYAVTSCAGSLTGPIAGTYVFPAVSEIVMVCLGRAAVPVTIRKSPAVLMDGKATEIWGTLDSFPLVACWIIWIGDAITVAVASLDGALTLPTASTAVTR